MKRAAELIIIVSTLAAIISTFFLYRSNGMPIQQTASVIESDEAVMQEAAPDTVIEQSTSTSATTSEPTSEEPTPEAAAPEIKKSIIVEKLPITANEIETLTTQIHSLTNLSRSQNNLPKLTLDTSLSAVAQKRSKEMIEKNYFSHTSPSGCDISCQMKNSGYQTMTWGENLATTNDYHLYTTSELAQTFVADWLKSSTHRDNLLSKKFTHHGIGIVSAGERIVITVVFAAP